VASTLIRIQDVQSLYLGLVRVKAAPLHAMKALVARFTPGERTPVSIVQEAGWAPESVWTQRLEEKSFRLCRGTNLDRPVVLPVARRYTD
jgi:precorrin-4 methylase